MLFFIYYILINFVIVSKRQTYNRTIFHFLIGNPLYYIVPNISITALRRIQSSVYSSDMKNWWFLGIFLKNIKIDLSVLDTLQRFTMHF